MGFPIRVYLSGKNARCNVRKELTVWEGPRKALQCEAAAAIEELNTKFRKLLGFYFNRMFDKGEKRSEGFRVCVGG